LPEEQVRRFLVVVLGDLAVDPQALVLVERGTALLDEAVEALVLEVRERRLAVQVGRVEVIGVQRRRAPPCSCIGASGRGGAT
jgi:hypothetical protein